MIPCILVQFYMLGTIMFVPGDCSSVDPYLKVKQNTFPCFEIVFRFFVFEYFHTKVRDIDLLLDNQLGYVLMH